MSSPKPNIDTCNACGKLFPRSNMRLCTRCALNEQNRFMLVREYITDHDGAPIGEIASATGVSSSDVRKFCDSGRLIEKTYDMTSCTCGGVGERCRFCRSQLTTSFRHMEEKMRREQAERDAGTDQTSRTSYVRRIRRIAD